MTAAEVGSAPIAHKNRQNSTAGGDVLELLALKLSKALRRYPCTKSSIYRFPYVFSVLSWLLHMNRSEVWLLLRALRDAGFIEIIPGHGVRFREEVLGNGQKS